jgi:benzoate 4-monooxygenase
VVDFGGMVRYLVMHRIANPPDKPDLFSSMPLKPTPKRPQPVPLHEIMAENTTMLDAGNDTTQTSLTNTLYLLSLNPRTQAKLRQILTKELSEEERPVASYQRLQHIPYLRAVLDESFRVRPPVNFGLPRKTVAPTMIAGHEISAGVTISSPLDALHRNPKLFSDPEEYVPERWLADSDYHPEERFNLKEYVLPFSLGGRACIGRNLACEFPFLD